MAKRGKSSESRESSVSGDSILEQPSLGSAPTPEEAEKAVEAQAEKAKEPPPKKVEPSQSVVPFRVYAALSGLKETKLKPFAFYVRKEEMKPCSVPEWRERYDAFQKRVVR
jgi:hypothetical protein